MAKKEESCGNRTDDTEAAFLASLLSENTVFRRVGSLKHFSILIAFDRYPKSLPKSSRVQNNINFEAFWNKLGSFYNLEALEKSSGQETIFPSEMMEFKLPDDWVTNKETQSFSSSKDVDSATATVEVPPLLHDQNAVAMKKRKTEEATGAL